jgi:Na+/phosphate symporter
MAGLLILCVLLLVQSSLLHKRRTKENFVEVKNVEKNSVIEQCKEDVYSVFEQISRIYSQTLSGLADEDRKKLNKLYKEAKDLYKKEKERKTIEMLPMLSKLQDDAVNTGHYFVQVLDYLYEVSKSLLSITKESFEYIDDNHAGMSPKQVSDLEEMNKAVSSNYASIVDMLRTTEFSNFEKVLAKRDSTFDLFADNIKSQIKRIKNNESTKRNSILFLDIVSETKTMMLQARNLMRAQRLFLGYEEENLRKQKKN